MVLMAAPSLPTSVLPSASGIRAVRSPWVVIRCAVPAISLTGAPPPARGQSPPPPAAPAPCRERIWPPPHPCSRPQPRRGPGHVDRSLLELVPKAPAPWHL